ncbi:MAG: homoserine kinase [Hyphomicrobiaceae bacterium]|nr:homoserine kinase [Hyphomicrobiaceae bacterium]
MAVYTEVSDEELSAFIADYDLGNVLSFKGIAEGVENTNYLIHTEAGPHILTLYEKRVKEEDLPFFLGLMEHLSASGLACPVPVRDREGRMLREIAGRPAAIITFLEGLWIRRPSAEHCAALGATLAKLHLSGQGFAMSRPNALSVGGWRPLYEASGKRTDEIADGLYDELGRELKTLEAEWPRDLPQGVIHADLFPDNVFFLGRNISGVIDFYFACNDALAYDIAICLNAWCFEPDAAFNITKARALLRSYTEMRPFSKEEFDVLPMLARGAAMRFLLTRVYDWLNTSAEALVRPKDPNEYVRKLRFHRSVASTREYGLGE